MKKRAVWAIGAGTALLTGFFVCRYTFFDLHGMKQWPIALLIVGLIIVAVAAIFDARKVMALTAVGYIAGFAMGMLFRVRGVDQGGGSTNNAWVIWTVSLFIAILAGIVWEIVGKYATKRKV